MHAVSIERRHGTACGRSEADDDRGQATAVVAGRAAQLQGVDDGAVPGELIVLVEDVQAEAAVAAPVVHGLPRDEREALVDGELRDLGILHAVRPAPQHLALPQGLHVGGLRLGQQHDVGPVENLCPIEHAAHEGLELGIGAG